MDLHKQEIGVQLLGLLQRHFTIGHQRTDVISQRFELLLKIQRNNPLILNDQNGGLGRNHRFLSPFSVATNANSKQAPGPSHSVS